MNNIITAYTSAYDKYPTWKKWLVNLLWVVAALLVIFNIAVYSYLGLSTNTSENRSSASGLSTIKFNNYESKLSHGVMLLSGTIKNQGNAAVYDVEITCNHFAPSGTKIDSNTRTVYQQILNGFEAQITDFNMGFVHSQVARSECKVTKVR